MSMQQQEHEKESDSLLDDVINEVIKELQFTKRPTVDGTGTNNRPLTVRDATADVLSLLGRVPPSRTEHRPPVWPPSAWNTPAVRNYHFGTAATVPSIGLTFAQRTVAPEMEHRVLEIKDVPAPQLFAVSWPNSLRNSLAVAAHIPFLIYLRPAIGPNVKRGYYAGPGLGEYPFGWDYLFHGLWRWINYMGDPLTANSYAKGIPYQVTAAGRKLVLVLPLNRYPGELGVFTDAEWMHRILSEINAWISREIGASTVPAIGRTALAAFGSGNTFLKDFLAAVHNQPHLLYRDLIRELYLFDPPTSDIPATVAELLRWARSGSGADKVIRMYSQTDHDSFRYLLGPTAFSDPIANGTNLNSQTVAVLPVSTWVRGEDASQGAISRQDAHELIGATMLTDALARSGFEEESGDGKTDHPETLAQ